ncbi:hypothetical protein TSAR_009584 [Trichomalopsis sarcophagae]|uniref:Uncharacterized protein n=1 Tax=Trichomalopsis sarcophagae TaxID=543379 RepID=A0A232FGH4_9HYME|nr:hypothetical protein TSAR_009584 [Trichomalopsis sarcophagae]
MEKGCARVHDDELLMTTSCLGLGTTPSQVQQRQMGSGTTLPHVLHSAERKSTGCSTFTRERDRLLYTLQPTKEKEPRYVNPSQHSRRIRLYYPQQKPLQQHSIAFPSRKSPKQQRQLDKQAGEAQILAKNKQDPSLKNEAAYPGLSKSSALSLPTASSSGKTMRGSLKGNCNLELPVTAATTELCPSSLVLHEYTT